MKKLIKYLFIILLVLFFALLLTIFFSSEKLPQGKSGPEAEALAQKMLLAVNKTAWDTTKYVQWTFRGPHHYDWNRETDIVEVKWSNNRVILHTKTQQGQVYVNEQLIPKSESSKLIQKAWEYFCNDSFWLLAPTKIYDQGVERSLVKLKDGREGLMITYGSGGVTPGDSYLWLLDENGLPTSYKMWVSIIPIGGIEFSWENWIALESGAMVAQSHKKSFFDVSISNLSTQANQLRLEGNFRE